MYSNLGKGYLASQMYSNLGNLLRNKLDENESDVRAVKDNSR